MKDFSRERVFFKALKNGLDSSPDLVAEVEGAFNEIHARYDTRVWENRFVAGGITEQIIGSAARALGLPVLNAGKNNQGYDLELSSGAGISIKAVFASTRGSIRLINSLGSGVRQWTDATIFPVAGVGIGYSDCELTPGLTTPTGDALVISGRGLQEFWAEHPEWLISSVDVPPKLTSSNTAVASDVIAFELFQRFPLLMKSFRPEI